VGVNVREKFGESLVVGSSYPRRRSSWRCAQTWRCGGVAARTFSRSLSYGVTRRTPLLRAYGDRFSGGSGIASICGLRFPRAPRWCLACRVVADVRAAHGRGPLVAMSADSSLPRSGGPAVTARRSRCCRSGRWRPRRWGRSCARSRSGDAVQETRRRCDPEFRQAAVRIVRETGKPIAQVARARDPRRDSVQSLRPSRRASRVTTACR
jgi:hypothetical protein